MSGGFPSRPLLALGGREVNRVLKLWTQTIGAPVISGRLEP